MIKEFEKLSIPSIHYTHVQATEKNVNIPIDRKKETKKERNKLEKMSRIFF